MIHARVLGRAAEWRRRCSSCGAGDSRFVGCIEVKRRIFNLLIEFQIVRTLLIVFPAVRRNPRRRERRTRRAGRAGIETRAAFGRLREATGDVVVFESRGRARHPALHFPRLVRALSGARRRTLEDGAPALPSTGDRGLVRLRILGLQLLNRTAVGRIASSLSKRQSVGHLILNRSKGLTVSVTTVTTWTTLRSGR